MRFEAARSASCLLLLTTITHPMAAQTSASPQATDSAARAIITRVIARRAEILADMARSRYQAYVKVAARDLSESPDSARSVLLLAEVQSSVYWEHPDHYQETIEARHRPNEGGIGRAPVSVDEILHFEGRHVVLQEGGDPTRIGGGSGRSLVVRGSRPSARYSLPLPVAPRAMRHYDFQVGDTSTVDGQRVIRLIVRPKGDAPLFTGTIDVLDSTGDLVAMDLGVDSAVRFSTVSDLRYQQALRDAGDGRWLPYEIRLTGEMHRRLSAHWLPRTVVGMPVPQFPRRVAFEEVAALSEYSFDSQAPPPSDLAEYRAVLWDRADHPDTATWSAPEAVPLTDAERVAWEQGDSAEHHPGLVPRLARDADAVQQVALGPGSFHYNRVDGVYLGAAHQWRVSPALLFTTKLGYALGSERWQYRAGGRMMLWEPGQVWVGATYHDETVSWPSIAPSGYDPTASALVSRIDPNDYYRDRGLTLSLGTKLIDFTRLELRYNDAWQSTLDTLPGLSFHSTRYPPLLNPPIQDGHLRSVAAILTFDSRQMIRSRGGDTRLSGMNWTRVSVEADVSPHDVLASDFSFQRYSFQIQHQQQLRGLGVTTLSIAGGVATHFAPPQEYFTLGYGLQLLAADGNGFNTLGRTEYAGNRALMISARHDLGRIFMASGVSFLRWIPATVALRGGVFWASLVGNTPAPADTMLTMARRPYTEAGVTFANLTPFLAPFDFAASFTWQLSSYPTRGFRFGFGFSGP